MTTTTPLGGDTARLPTWRSLMFCPADSERFLAKAHTRGADAIILDLEDSVSAPAKPKARAGLNAAVASAGQSGADVLIRINRELDLAVADIAASIIPGVYGLVLPKVKGPEHVQLLSELVADRELAQGLPLGSTRFVALIETAASLELLGAIARSDPRMVSLAVGSEDLSTDLDAVPTADTLYVAKMLGVHAARAAGLLPMGLLASVAGVETDDAYKAMLERSRGLGFSCASCVHPAQVAMINEAFGPSPEMVAHARALVAAYEHGLASGAGAVRFEGRMIDKPVAQRAYRLLGHASATGHLPSAPVGVSLPTKR